ncbi:unnamed protein product [Amoebophrya sp. A120]|nr:unnamed protein product [Amoebophrya sp. A120]|eukprot:GSA120T00023516001.1
MIKTMFHVSLTGLGQEQALARALASRAGKERFLTTFMELTASTGLGTEIGLSMSDIRSAAICDTNLLSEGEEEEKTSNLLELGRDVDEQQGTIPSDNTMKMSSKEVADAVPGVQDENKSPGSTSGTTASTLVNRKKAMVGAAKESFSIAVATPTKAFPEALVGALGAEKVTSTAAPFGLGTPVFLGKKCEFVVVHALERPDVNALSFQKASFAVMGCDSTELGKGEPNIDVMATRCTGAAVEDYAARSGTFNIRASGCESTQNTVPAPV